MREEPREKICYNQILPRLSFSDSDHLENCRFKSAMNAATPALPPALPPPPDKTLC
ncbi:MAG: hypothetical protein ACTSRA_21060 [Promethearchaeota archaeon]